MVILFIYLFEPPTIGENWIIKQDTEKLELK